MHILAEIPFDLDSLSLMKRAARRPGFRGCCGI